MIPMTRYDIKDAINALSVTASPGSDGVPAVMLKKCRDFLLEPLYVLWTKSMCSGKVLENFKTAHVTRLLKPGCQKSKGTTYRSGSLTSHIDKTYERVVNKYLQNFLEFYFKSDKTQHSRKKIMSKSALGTL